MEDGARKVSPEQKIAPLTNMQQGLGQGVEVQTFQLLESIVLHKTLAGHLQPESVLRAKIVFELDSHCSCGLWGSTKVEAR